MYSLFAVSSGLCVAGYSDVLQAEAYDLAWLCYFGRGSYAAMASTVKMI